MARDNITRTSNYVSGAGGFEGGAVPTESTQPTPELPQEVEDKVIVKEEPKLDDKIIVEDIDMSNVDKGESHDDLVEKIFKLYQLKKTNKGEAKKLEKEMKEEMEEREPIIEDVVESEPINDQSEIITDPIKKKRKHRKERENSNFFSRIWDSFFDVFEFKNLASEKMTKAYLSVALLISFISMFHVQGLFALVNPPYLAWAISISIELAVIVSLFSLKMLDKVSAWMIWTLIGSLFFVQSLGNTFSAYVYFSTEGNILHSMFVEMVNMFGADPTSIGLKRVVSVVLGGLFPFFALLMVKSVSEYLDNSDDDDYDWDDDEED